MKAIDEAIRSALQNHEKDKLKLLRFLKSALKYKKIDLRRELEEAEEFAVLKAQIKKKQEAIKLYEQGKRDDLVEKEKADIALIQKFLPEPMTRAEMEKIVEETVETLNAGSMRDMGRVMKELTANLGSRADGKTLSSLVKAKLQN